jgi:hypothetical protein
MSVDGPALTCGGRFGVAFTLTVGAEIPGGPEWVRVQRRLLDWMRVQGVVFWHVVTEFQARGAPHLHGMAYFPQHMLPQVGELASGLVAQWVRLVGATGATGRGQVVKLVTAEVGWLEYLAKHASRGAMHYQRARETMPASWRDGGAGKMWRKGGPWPRGLELDMELDDVAWYRLRRLVRAYRVAKVRGYPKGRARAIRAARGMLRHADPKLSRLRGVAEWAPQNLTLSMLANVASNGGEVESVDGRALR